MWKMLFPQGIQLYSQIKFVRVTVKLHMVAVHCFLVKECDGVCLHLHNTEVHWYLTQLKPIPSQNSQYLVRNMDVRIIFSKHRRARELY